MTSLEMTSTMNANLEITPRRTVTLKVDDAFRGNGIQTSEFELPDALVLS